MSRPEIRAFEEQHLEAAGALLAARHREHRAAEPLLSQEFEQTDAARAEVASLWAQEHASGAVALREGRLAGFLLGTRKDDSKWGANIWIEAAGYAVDRPELVRDLYAFSSQGWVDQGRTRHYALVPSLDDLVAPWFRLSFGVQQSHGIKQVNAATWPAGTRRAEPRDLEALIELAPLIYDHHALAPVFAGIDVGEEDPEELRAEIAADIANDEIGELVFEQDGRVVACFEVVSASKGSTHQGLARPEGAALIGYAASLPDVRGAGTGLALTEASFAWAHEQGYTTMITDWREANLLASRFWPARGFRRSFLRLYRSIP